MLIVFSPYEALPGSGDKLVLARQGDTLIINGASIDMSPIPNGATVRDAHDFHPMLIRSIERSSDGVLTITLRLPYHGSSGHVDAPPPIVDPPDGPISIPVIQP